MRALVQKERKEQMAADERRSTQIRTAFLSAFIGVHRRPLWGFACMLAMSTIAFAQPSKLLGPPRQSQMQDRNLKPALPDALKGVGIDQRLDQQVSLDLLFRDEA